MALALSRWTIRDRNMRGVSMKITNTVAVVWVSLAMSLLLLSGCSSSESLPPASSLPPAPSPDYIIGPLDSLTIFVRRNPELTQTIPVRPDGRISAPLISDMQAAGKTPTQLSHDIQE